MAMGGGEGGLGGGGGGGVVGGGGGKWGREISEILDFKQEKITDNLVFQAVPYRPAGNSCS